jgi:hypothetical protein
MQNKCSVRPPTSISAVSWTGPAATLGEEAGDGEPDDEGADDEGADNEAGTDNDGAADGGDAPPPQATRDAIVKARDTNVGRDIGRLQGADAMPDPRRRIAADEMGESRPR